MKQISDLKLGDKVFIIDKIDCTFDVAEVIEVLNVMIRFQCYLSNKIFYLWKYLLTRYDYYDSHKIIFTDENEAIEEFKFLLKHNQNGGNR